MKGRILVVCQDLMAASRLRNMLCAQEYMVHMARRADDALALLGFHRIDVLIVNPCLQDHDVQWLCSQASKRHPNLKKHMIFLADGELPENVKAFVEESGNDIVVSPIDAGQLEQVLSRHMR
ncbi:MAG: response regulator [Anaerolineales bacterium]|nr:MAG: response regulator [Anaerolineales bacterium]